MNNNISSDPKALASSRMAQRTLKRLILLGLIPLLAIVVLGVVYLRGGRIVETENAYLKADKVSVSSEVSGTVKELFIRENQAVAAGQLLFRLDAAPFRLAVAKAEAKLSQVRTDLAVMRASYREKQAEITLARTRHAFALKEQGRQAELVNKKFVSAAKFDDAKQSADLAGQQMVVTEQDLKRIAESLGGSLSTPVEQHPAYLSAQAELEQVRLDLLRVEVRAATTGTVSKLPKLGQFVQAGSMAMVLVVNDKLWVEANLPETDLTYVHPGQSVKIHVDTFPDEVWTGEVESLSPATGAEFSLIPAQNATGNWIKIAQRVPVRIRIIPDSGRSELRTGLSAKAEIDTGHRRSLFGFSL
ncbi:HlyD family secretion protein [Rhodoferax sp.]|uniref:HlyD family secretion protein n=1 Tax=Rhodoferax sp. TaxID=50421 RepID=UPI00260172C1|nr:HlyD family secretion protein [Rhodoferax sp.]MDD3935412.1 HlyD family secretion protein [Rhodoferax sp.]